MKLKYANQLNGHELCELYSAFIKERGGFKIEPIGAIQGVYTIDLNGFYYDLDDDNTETLLHEIFEINDYGVLDNTFGFGYNTELTKILRKFMLNKFGKQYLEDCFWNDFGGANLMTKIDEFIKKIERLDSHLKVVRKPVYEAATMIV